jgi:uncharacterized membrane protein (DUF106 family)
MLDAINSLCLTITDPLLGWMLDLPRDVALFIVAIGTAVILTGVRLFTTNQARLKRCKEDKARLKMLVGEAKKRRDKEAVKRYRTTLGQIGMTQMASEGKPLLASIIPIALLAVWAFSRIAFMAPDGSKPITVKATFPTPQIGKMAHLEPVDGIAAENGWLRPIVTDYDRVIPGLDEWAAASPFESKLPKKIKKIVKPKVEEKKLGGDSTGDKGKEKKKEKPPQENNGLAVWRLKCERRDEPYTLVLHRDNGSFEKELIVDGKQYAAPFEFYYDGNEMYTIETKLEEYKPFGIVPGIEAIAFAPWIVGYLIIVIPFSLIMKPVLKIY